MRLPLKRSQEADLNDTPQTYELQVDTTLQSIFSQHRDWHCHENRLIKTIQTIPHNIYVSVKLISLYCGLRLILVYPNPQLREVNLTLTYRFWGII